MANFLEIGKQRLANWRSRDRLDLEILLGKLEPAEFQYVTKKTPPGLSSRLRTAREQHQWKPSDLARQMKVSVEEVHQIEDGLMAPSEDWINKVAEITSCDLTWLRTGLDRAGNFTPSIFQRAAGKDPTSIFYLPPSDTLEVGEPSRRYMAPEQVFYREGRVEAAVTLLLETAKEKGLDLTEAQVGAIAERMVQQALLTGNASDMINEMWKLLRLAIPGLK